MKVKTEDESNQETCHKACSLIYELTQLNQNIPGHIWIAACFAMIVTSYKNKGWRYETFRKDVEIHLEHYKSWWEE